MVDVPGSACDDELPVADDDGGGEALSIAANAAQAASNAVAETNTATLNKMDHNINGLAVVADIQPPGRGAGPEILEAGPPAASASQDSKAEEFFSLHPNADVGAGFSASVLSPSDVQRSKLLALHGHGTRAAASHMNLMHDRIAQSREDAVVENKTPAHGAAETKSSLKNGPKKAQDFKQNHPNLSVEIEESHMPSGSMYDPSDSMCVRRSTRAREVVEELIKDVPLGTVLLINKMVIKAQARIRGIISRRQLGRQMKRHSGHLGGANWTNPAHLRPDEDEIVTFCDNTQVSAASCQLTSLAFVDGKLTMPDTVADDHKGRHSSNSLYKTHKVTPSPQEEDAEEKPGFGYKGLHVGAGYFQFNAIGIEFGIGCVARYLCLETATPDVKTAENGSLEVSAIPTAFVHLKLRCRNLKNMDGLLGKSDPFFTISRIDDPGSLAENNVKVYTSQVIADNLNPQWPKLRIPLQKLSSGDKADNAVLLFEVWDKDSFSADDRIGVARCSLREIQSGVEVPLMSEDGSKGAPNGTLIFESCRVELKYYKFGGLANPALLRFYAEHVWNLPKPEVLISITSGLAEYHLESSIEDSLLYDMMEMCNHLNAWVITNGSATGFSRRVGAYRAKYAVTTPLIGICSTPESKITDATPRRGNMAFSQRSARSLSSDHSRSNTSIQGGPEWMAHIDESLDSNHSHFILCHNAPMSGRALTKMRTEFEACVGQNSSWPPIKDYVSKTMQQHDIDWPEAEYSHGPTLPTPDNIPIVKVCVQGGAGAIRTILHAVNDNIPVLLVRGTGKATDIIADCVCLKFPIGHPKHLERTRLSHRQKILYDCIENLRVLAGKRLPKMDFYSKLDFYHKDQAHPWKNREKEDIKDLPLDDPSGLGYSSVVQLLKHVDLLDAPTQTEIEYRTAKVMSAYDVPVGPNIDNHSGSRILLIQVLLAARNKGCWVYDLEVNNANFRKGVDEERVNDGLQRPTDFKGSLLHCLLNGIQNSREDHFSSLRTQVSLCIKWERPDALHWLLRKNSATMQRYVFQNLVDMVLQTAVSTHNEDAVVKLVEYGANLSAYRFTLQGGEREETEEGWLQSKLAAEKKMQQAARLWENLMVACKTDPSTRHVYDLLKLTKKKFRDRARLTAASRGSDGQNTVNASDLSKLVGWEAFHNLEWQNVVEQMEVLQGAELDKDERDEIKERCKTWQRITLLQSLYQDLLGQRFRYFFGILDSPNFDLFLWFVLSNRPNMAVIFWHFCKQPILTALVGAYLCRKMANHPTSKHAAYAEELLNAAKKFEKLAIQVCKSAFLDNRYKAMAALEQPLPLWPGLKLIDLAYQAGCLEFISTCCSRGIDRRWAGDLMHTDHTYALPGGFRLVLSVDSSVVVTILLGCGLFAPLLLPIEAWEAPPKHQNFRHSTQRRQLPKGYPYDPLANTTMQRVLGLHNADRSGASDQQTSTTESLKREKSTPAAWRRKVHTVATDASQSTRTGKTSKRDRNKGMWSSLGALWSTHSNDRQRVEVRTAQLIEKLKSDRFSDGSLLNQLWEPTFGYWERLHCFYRAPVTLFWLNAGYQVLVAVCGITYLVELQDAVFRTTHVASGLGNATHYNPVPNLPQDATYAMDRQFKAGSSTDWLQSFLMLHHVCQLVLTQISVWVMSQDLDWGDVSSLGGGTASEVRWNSIQATCSLCFLVAYCLKHQGESLLADSTHFYAMVRSYVLNPEALEQWFTFPVLSHRPGVVYLLEGLSIAGSCATFLRVLSIFKPFGKFVLTFFSMFRAIKHGLVVWVLLHASFVFLRTGMTMLCQTYPDYLLDGATVGEYAVTCSDNPVNSFALLFNTEADWDYGGQMTELWFLYFLVFFVVQVVLMNLFIALMSSKFAECMDKADHTFVIHRFELSQSYSCVSLVCFGPIVALPLFIFDLALFGFHYKGLKRLYPSCTKRALLLLHLTRSSAHRDDLAFSWFRGVTSRVTDTGDAGEVQQLHCFLENARRHFMRSHFPGKRFITLQAVGALDDYTGHASLQLELKMQAAHDTIKGAMEEMRNHHDAIYANQAKIAKAQEDGRVQREAIAKLSKHAGIRVLPGQAADWSKQAEGMNTRGFAMANTAGGFGTPAKAAKLDGGGSGGGGGFAQTLGQHGVMASGSKPAGVQSPGGGFAGWGGGRGGGLGNSARSGAAGEQTVSGSEAREAGRGPEERKEIGGEPPRGQDT